MRHLTVVAALVFGYASSAGATAPDTTQPPSPFLLCDGFTGHVSAGETLGRLLALTATAGLSEAATRKDDEGLRAKGRPAAESCDVALGQESDGARRMRLGIAKAIHLLEAEAPLEALSAIRKTGELGGVRATEWGVSHTLGAYALYVEAVTLAHLRRPDEAEAAALRSAEAAGWEVLGLLRAVRFIGVTPAMTPMKRDYLRRLASVLPGKLQDVAESRAWAGDFSGAAQAIAAGREMSTPYFKKNHSGYFLDAQEAVYRFMAGDVAAASALAEKARKALDIAVAAGAATESATLVARSEEALNFIRVGVDLEEGRLANARSGFAARGRWLLTSPPSVVAMAERLRARAASAPGPAIEDPAALRASFLSAKLASIAAPDEVEQLFKPAAIWNSDADYKGASGAVWKIGAKPRFLLRDTKTIENFELISTEPRLYGPVAGEALLLHAALIAKSRGLDGFTFMPVRSNITWTGVRFGSIGQPGFPESASLRADDIIAALSPRIPAPVAR